MASILDEIRSEVESELSAQSEEKPKSILDEIKQEVSAELAPKEPKTDFFKTAQQSLEEKPPTKISGGDVFLNAISHKRSNELDDEDKGLFNALSDDEQYKVAQARKDIPLDDAQARKIFEIEKSKMPSIPTSWEDWYNLGGDAVDVIKNVAKIPIKVGLGAGELARDVINATDMTVSDEQALKNLQKAKGSVYSFMAPVFELPESVTWAATKAKEGGFSWADALGEKAGLVDPEERFDRWKGRRLVDQAHAEYFKEHPTVYGRMLDNPLTKDALAFIAKSEMESPKELASRTGISVEEAKKQQDDLVKKGIEDFTSQMEEELPEEQAGPRIAGEFLLPGELGMGTMGAVSLVAKVTPEIAKGLKYIGKTDDEIAEINKAAQVLEKQKFEKMLEQRTARAESFARGAEKLEEAVQKFKPIAEKATGTLSKIAAPVIGGVAGYEAAPESPLAGLLTGALGGAAARSVLKGTKLGLEIPTLVKEVAEARKVAPLGKTFETLGKSAEGSALKAKLLSHGGKTIDNILSNASEYAKAGIHGTTLALTTGALESADPEEMKQILSDGLAISLGGRALQHIKGKFMGIDPVIAQRERISDDSRIHRRFQESDADTQANLNQMSDFNNAILFREKKLSESQSVLASAITSNDSARIKEAQSLVDANTKALSLTKRANVQTRNEFGRQFLKTYADLQDITNGVLRTGQNNVGFNILSTDQIYQKLRNDPANKDVPDVDLAQMASQAGFYSNPAQEGVVFDRRKPSIVLNADSIRERIRTFGESPQEALVHESSHFMDAVPEFQDALGDVRSMLFQNEIRDAAGNIKATTPGVFSKAKLVELFNDGYLRHLDPQGKESFAKLNKLWDESRGQLDENRVSEYMKREVMADLLGEVTSRHLGKDLSSATLAMFDRAKIKARKNLLDRAINRFYGFGGRGDIVAAANTRAEFPPEAMAAARDAMRQIVALNGEISPPVAEAQMPKISRAQMMKNSALLDRFGKDSPLFKTEFKVKVFDKDGNQIGESMPVTTPNPREGTFQSEEGGFKKLSGYGDIPVEAQGLQVPEGGTLVVSRDLVMQPDGVTPVMYDAKDAKKIASERRKLIVEALDTDDYGTPNRFEQVSEGSETYRGTFTPAQIKAIQDMPESLIPKTLKQHMLKVNDAIARGDGTRFITDYAAVMNDNGTYQAFSPKIYDLVPIGMHLSKAGNFLVTTISVGRIFDKMRLWNERMPGRLRFWDNNLERTFDDFTKYLNNWQKGERGETGLDADPQIALQKKNIFNDLLNLYDKATEYTNLDRTEIPRKKGDPRGKDPNRTIMSIRVDHIAEMLENQNATKLPVSYGFAKQNFMPERMEGEVAEPVKKAVTQPERYPTPERGFYSGLQQTIDQKVQGKFASPDQLKAIISNPQNVKAEELKWSGVLGEIDRLAAENQGKVPKDKVMEYLRNEGAVKFEEVTLGGKEPFDANRLAELEAEYKKLKQHPIDDPSFGEDKYDELIRLMNIRDQSTTETLYDEAERVMNLAQQAQRRGDKKTAEKYFQENEFLNTRAEKLDLQGQGLKNPPKFAQYQLPSGENYREVVLSMPNKIVEEEANLKKQIFELNKRQSQFEQQSPEWNEIQKQLRGLINRQSDLVRIPSSEREGYTSSHFPEVQNYVAHMRLNERTDAEGNKGLFVEEFQSDRHQQGREKGYAVTQEEINESNILTEKAKQIGGVSKLPEKEKARWYELSDKINASNDKSLTPDAPFRKDWGVQLFKRALRDAVESGKSWIGWTTGIEQVNRYENDMRSKVDEITWQTINGDKSIRAMKYNNVFFGGAIDKDGNIRGSGTEADGKQVSDVFGKAIASKVSEDYKGSLAGDDLTVGGEGMKGFYDTILPKEIGKYVSKMGGKVEKSGIITERASTFTQFIPPRRRTPNAVPKTTYIPEKVTPIWRVNITPEMAGKVKGGQLQFMPERPVGKTQAGYDYSYLDQALSNGKEGRVALTRPVRADEALPLLSQRIPITEEVEKDLFDYTRPAEVAFYQHENKPVSFKFDPQLIEKPVFKDAEIEHAGKNVQLAMADRQTATGGDMGGIIFPWLKSNANSVIVGDDRIKYRPVWANNEWKPVLSMKNKNINFNAFNLLTYLMGPDAHASNAREVRNISNEIENAQITRQQKDLFLILANIGVKKQKRADQQKNIKSANDYIEETKKLIKESSDKEEIKKLNNEIKLKEKDIELAKLKYDQFLETSDEELIKSVITKYKTAYTRFKGGTGSENTFIKNKSALDEFKKTKSFKNLLKIIKNKQLISLDDTFKGRKASIAQILGLTIDDFNVDNVLDQTMDFKNGRINHIVGSVELSRNPDLMAVYLGDDPKQAKRMTAQEAKAAEQLKADPNFVPHEAYSWVMLGPVNGNNFLNSNPKTHLEYFPDFKEAYANIQEDAGKKQKILEGNETTLMGAMRDNTQMPLAMPAISGKK